MADEHNSAGDDTNRRDFLYLATGAFAAIGAANIAWPLIHQMNPDASVKALASIEVDLAAIETARASPSHGAASRYLSAAARKARLPMRAALPKPICPTRKTTLTACKKTSGW